MNSSKKQQAIICLFGPTASGKTDLAISLLADFPCDIISVDSAMVYRGMDIGSAKPDADTLAQAPHRLIDIRDPQEPYSAADFVQDAKREIAAIHANNRIPLLVGGTMLYYRALLQGFNQLPSANPEIRAKLDAMAESEGLASLHAKLKQVDPQSAERIHANDSQRIQRALEVFELTGKPLSEHWQVDVKPEFDNVLQIALNPSDRAVLHERIERRFHIMLEQGFIAEVEALRGRGDLDLELPSMRAVGYRQVWEYLDGLYSKEEMIARAIASTRQLAKRQLTWLRSWPDVVHLDSLETDIYQKLYKQVANLVS